MSWFLLGGGFKDCLFHPYLGKWSNLTIWYFANGLKPPTSLQFYPFGSWRYQAHLTTKKLQNPPNPQGRCLVLGWVTALGWYIYILDEWWIFTGKNMVNESVNIQLSHGSCGIYDFSIHIRIEQNPRIWVKGYTMSSSSLSWISDFS